MKSDEDGAIKNIIDMEEIKLIKDVEISQESNETLDNLIEKMSGKKLEDNETISISVGDLKKLLYVSTTSAAKIATEKTINMFASSFINDIDELKF